VRVRTAVGITAGIITAQVAAAWFAEKAWLALPESRWPPARWHIELGNLSEALAAFAGAGAALIALWIAGRDRRDRKAERWAEENTVARLVRLDVQAASGRPVVVVKVRNFGPLPILDVTGAGATWTTHSDARLPITRLGRPTVGRQLSVLRPWNNDLKYEEMVEFEIQFLHPSKDETLVPKVDHKVPGGVVPMYEPVELSTVVAKIQFTTPNGIRWETITDGAGTGETRRV
jgi:hypothetical protein